MTDPKPPKRIFAEAKVDARAAKHVPSSPQTESEAYKLAFQDNEFLLRPDLRPVRFQLELLKPELLMNEDEPWNRTSAAPVTSPRQKPSSGKH